MISGDKPQNYGAQRMWGAASWGICSFINGIVVDTFSKGMPNKNFIPSYYLLLTLLFLDLLVFLNIKVILTSVLFSIIQLFYMKFLFIHFIYV